MNASEKPWQFRKGQPGGPGRPPGMRNRLSETMLALMAADASEHGAEVLATVRKEKPHVWLQCMVALLPRQVAIEKVSPLGHLSDAEVAEIEQYLTASHARTVRQLEAQRVEPEAEPPMSEQPERA